ncbi:hypothetical protein NVP1167O_18 [Vibrio phage 1.167.O._10N.261.51.F2]|nr:hypothetical protein NVP1167O_18 [Vibrio phage 1.167.O._10N.261.51.F2]
MSATLSDGKSTRREELEVMQKMRGAPHPELDYPSPPSRWMPALRASRDIADFSYFELKAYSEMMGVSFSPIETDVIRDLQYVKQAIRGGATPQKVLEGFGYGSTQG